MAIRIRETVELNAELVESDNWASGAAALNWWVYTRGSGRVNPPLSAGAAVSSEGPGELFQRRCCNLYNKARNVVRVAR